MLPSNVREVERSCGSLNFIGRFFPNFTTKMRPIFELRKTDTIFKWTTNCQNGFDSLKKNHQKPWSNIIARKRKKL